MYPPSQTPTHQLVERWAISSLAPASLAMWLSLLVAPGCDIIHNRATAPARYTTSAVRSAEDPLAVTAGAASTAAVSKRLRATGRGPRQESPAEAHAAQRRRRRSVE